MFSFRPTYFWKALVKVLCFGSLNEEVVLLNWEREA